jgi:uncharacterized protein YkwD/uncharacterized membrane protein required for colicin V production
MNWVDLVIIAVLLYYSYEGWHSGLAYLGFHFLSFLASLYIAMQFYPEVGAFLAGKFGIPTLWIPSVGFTVVAIASEIVFSFLIDLIVARIPTAFAHSKLNKIFGLIVSVGNGVVITTFFLLLIHSVPLRGTIKRDVSASVLGAQFIAIAQQYGGPLEGAVDQVNKQLVKFLTIEPDSKESLTLDFTLAAADLKVDPVMEQAMLRLVNSERAKVGVKPLSMDATIVTVARAHSRDMFLRKYFSHIAPDGTDPLQRMEAGNVTFEMVGENIAYAPDLDSAHTGLMNSPGHKRNILDPQYSRIGIGIITTESYGSMFTQNFAD